MTPVGRGFGADPDEPPTNAPDVADDQEPSPTSHVPVDATAVVVGGVSLAAVDLRECARLIMRRHASGLGDCVMTHNLEHLDRAARCPSFADQIAQATIAVADGMPLVWASGLQRTPLPGRVNGTDLLQELIDRCAVSGETVYFVGGRGDTAARLVDVLSAARPSLKIAGAHSPPAELRHDPSSIDDILARIKAAAPDYVFIGLPSDLQATIGVRLLEDFPSTTSIGVGVSFSYLTGERRRAPRWMQRLGLEWLHRLVREPAELGPRYVVRCVPVGIGLLAASAARGWRNRPRHGEVGPE